MDLLSEALQGRKVFRIHLPDGQRISFRLLSWGEFNAYYEAANKGIIAVDIIEDAIFRKCVIEKRFIDTMYEMRAGIVSTVATLILSFSGPTNAETFNRDMDIHRAQAGNLNSQIRTLICQAFPAYKPEDLETMTWPVILERLAQAEQILRLEEPIRLLTAEEQEKANKKGSFDIEKMIKEGIKEQAVAPQNMPRGSQVAQRRPQRKEPMTPQQEEQLRKIAELKRRR